MTDFDFAADEDFSEVRDELTLEADAWIEKMLS